MQPTDEVEYYVKMQKDPNSELENVMVELKELLQRYLKQDIFIVTEGKSGEKLIIQEEQEVRSIFTSYLILGG